jgi:hypothetical protein
MFMHAAASFYWTIGAAVRLTLSSTSLTGPTYSATSDKRLKFNEKPLTNALNVINKLEPLEYDQTQAIVDQFNENTPHIHQCGFIAQSIQEVEELKHAVTGGEIGEDGKESIRSLNYNAIFTYAVKSIQELSQLVKAQQMQIDEMQKQLQGAWCSVLPTRGDTSANSVKEARVIGVPVVASVHGGHAASPGSYCAPASQEPASA